ncbi:MAG: hypothetical protein M1500_00140, partial [Candidatus Marsarchaeota archaeon]|nr:hypothetical protein [Candidatus Marsarchaeota archaeon]
MNIKGAFINRLNNSSADWICENFDTLLEMHSKIKVHGRIKSFKKFGGIAFVHLFGADLQLIIDKSTADFTDFFNENAKTGDIVEAFGTILKNKGLNSLKVENIRVLAKCNAIIPKKINNDEFAVKHRYLDIIVDDKTKERFRRCSLIISNMRKFLSDEGFLEFDTGIIKSKY